MNSGAIVVCPFLSTRFLYLEHIFLHSLGLYNLTILIINLVDRWWDEVSYLSVRIFPIVILLRKDSKFLRY